MLANDILRTIGNTPHIRINRLFGSRHHVYIKSERANPGGSIKDRIALSMVEAAEATGQLKPGSTIVEPTSGNTGVGLAMVAAVKGYKLVLVMPDSMSVERRRLMLAYGARFELTPREKGMNGSIARATESRTANRSVMSAAIAIDPDPHCAAISASGAARRAINATEAPRRATCTASAAPIPLLAPVTTITVLSIMMRWWVGGGESTIDAMRPVDQRRRKYARHIIRVVRKFMS